MDRIVAGVQRFRSGAFAKDKDLFQSLASGQSPRALFITCSDSRIDPNLVTQTQPGELFILRTAGNIVPPYGSVRGGEAATIEYAIRALKVPNIIVCGHSHCGAMGGLLNLEGLGGLPAVAAYLEHAEATRQIVLENYAEEKDEARRVSLAVEHNVLVQLESLRTHPAVAAALGRGEVELHGWVYKFETGDVYAYSPEKREFAPLESSAPALKGPDHKLPPI